MHVAERRPADREDLVVLALADQRRLRSRGNQLRRVERHARIADAEDMCQPLPVRLNRLVVRLRRREIAIPELRARLEYCR